MEAAQPGGLQSDGTTSAGVEGMDQDIGAKLATLSAAAADGGEDEEVQMEVDEMAYKEDAGDVDGEE